MPGRCAAASTGARDSTRRSRPWACVSPESFRNARNKRCLSQGSGTACADCRRRLATTRQRGRQHYGRANRHWSFAMYKTTVLLRALALDLPLGFAAAPAAAQGATPATAKTKGSQARPAPAVVVPAPFPLDAAQHIQQLNADVMTPDLVQGA